MKSEILDSFEKWLHFSAHQRSSQSFPQFTPQEIIDLDKVIPLMSYFMKVDIIPPKLLRSEHFGYNDNLLKKRFSLLQYLNFMGADSKIGKENLLTIFFKDATTTKYSFERFEEITLGLLNMKAPLQHPMSYSKALKNDPFLTLLMALEHQEYGDKFAKKIISVVTSNFDFKLPYSSSYKEHFQLTYQAIEDASRLCSDDFLYDNLMNSSFKEDPKYSYVEFLHFLLENHQWVHAQKLISEELPKHKNKEVSTFNMFIELLEQHVSVLYLDESFLENINFLTVNFSEALFVKQKNELLGHKLANLLKERSFLNDDLKNSVVKTINKNMDFMTLRDNLNANNSGKVFSPRF